MISGPDGSTFVGGSTAYEPSEVRDKSFVAKLDRFGRPDKAFGDGGYAAVPVEPTRLAYDPYSGNLYVGTNTATGGWAGTGTTLGVMRLLADGSIDRSFGGRVVLAVDRRIETLNADGQDISTVQNLALFKLHADGTRDSRYGRRGVTEVLRGSAETAYLNDDNFTRHDVTRRSFFEDVRTSRHGKTQVLLRFETGVID